MKGKVVKSSFITLADICETISVVEKCLTILLRVEGVCVISLQGWCACVNVCGLDRQRDKPGLCPLADCECPDKAPTAETQDFCRGHTY